MKRLRLDDQLCFALYAATNAITRSYRPLLEEIGLTYPQYLVMLVLWQDGASTIGEIAKRLKLQPHALTAIIDRLEKQDFVRRSRSKIDRRTIRIHLTETGITLEHAASRVQQSVECDTQLNPEDLVALRDELTSLSERMVALEDETT